MNSREYFTEYFESLGARVKKMTTRDTTLVVVGEDPGQNKLIKAVEYGIPTISYHMLVYLGFFEERGKYRLRGIPTEVFAELILSMAYVAELLYAKAYTTNSDSIYRAFLRIARGIEELLSAAWGLPEPPAGAVAQQHNADSDSDDVAGSDAGDRRREVA